MYLTNGEGIKMSGGYCYNVHGITTLCSDVDLPELAAFRVKTLANVQPNIFVRTGLRSVTNSVQKKASIGKMAAAPPAQDDPKGRRHIEYREGLGAFGFNTTIDIQNKNLIEVTAAAILRFSPHVLYTNLIEPILRWNFVEKGYALVHGACIASGNRAYLVSARTDTGKTTTVLRILDRQAHRRSGPTFLADDLTLITADGGVRAYPKPLTISAHTVAAITAPVLTRFERIALLVQSQVHSRAGRRLAFWLMRSNLPLATINTYIQLLVPPPKFPVERLVPGVIITQQAKLAGLFIIERGKDGERLVENQEAIEILLRNCDDAYGFPPYHQLETMLCTADGVDLRRRERAIITSALNGRPATLLQSSTLDWAERIPHFMQQRKAPIYKPQPSQLVVAGQAAD